jgi:hypothetical protein
MLLRKYSERSKPADRQGRKAMGFWPSEIAGLLGVRQSGFFYLRVERNPMGSYEAT